MRPIRWESMFSPISARVCGPVTYLRLAGHSKRICPRVLRATNTTSEHRVLSKGRGPGLGRLQNLICWNVTPQFAEFAIEPWGARSMSSMLSRKFTRPRSRDKSSCTGIYPQSTPLRSRCLALPPGHLQTDRRAQGYLPHRILSVRIIRGHRTLRHHGMWSFY